jgi:hypothetical protein
MGAQAVKSSLRLARPAWTWNHSWNRVGLFLTAMMAPYCFSIHSLLLILKPIEA